MGADDGQFCLRSFGMPVVWSYPQHYSRFGTERRSGWNKLDIDRCVSQPAVLSVFMILGQSGTALTAWLSFEYEWKYVYYFMMGILLVSILLLFYNYAEL